MVVHPIFVVKFGGIEVEHGLGVGCFQACAVSHDFGYGSLERIGVYGFGGFGLLHQSQQLHGGVAGFDGLSQSGIGIAYHIARIGEVRFFECRGG